MSESRQSKDVVYAAAQGREYLRGSLKGKSPEFVRRFAGMVDDRETLDLLNYLCSIWSPEHTAAAGNFLDTRLAREILTSAHTRSIDEAYRQGNVSQLQGMVGLTNQTREGTEAIPEMAGELTREGTIGGIVGRPGSGKTAMGLDIARAWKAITGGTVITNITSWDGADHHVTRASELKQTMGEIEGQVLVLIDEGSQSLTSKGSEAADADAFAKFLKYIRKKEDGDKYAKQGSCLVIGHTKRDTGADIRRLYNVLFEKPNPNDPSKARILDSEGGKDQFEIRTEFTGITDTAETYAEHEASHFEVDLGDDDEDADDGPTTKEVEKRKDIETAIRAAKPWTDDAGMKYRDIADTSTNADESNGLVPYGKSWVGDRVREWKDGQHRDLVDGPTEETA